MAQSYPVPANLAALPPSEALAEANFWLSLCELGLRSANERGAPLAPWIRARASWLRVRDAITGQLVLPL